MSNRSAQAIIFFYSGLHYAPVSVRKAAWKLDRTFEAERTATFGSAVTHTGVVCFSPFSFLPRSLRKCGSGRGGVIFPKIEIILLAGI